MKELHMAAFILTIVGALNWALIALFDMNLVTTLFGTRSAGVDVVYILIGVSAVYLAVTHKGNCKLCNKK